MSLLCNDNFFVERIALMKVISQTQCQSLLETNPIRSSQNGLETCLKSKNFVSELDNVLPDVQGVQGVGVAPGEAGRRNLSAVVLVDLLVDAASVVLHLVIG